MPIASRREAGMPRVRGIDGPEAGSCFIVILGGVSQCSCADIRSIPMVSSLGKMEPLGRNAVNNSGRNAPPGNALEFLHKLFTTK